jgi:hypothetical protein
MTDFCIKTPAQVWDDLNPQPAQSVLITEWNDGADQQAYQYTTEDADPLPSWPVGSTVLGGWNDYDGLQYGETYDVDGTTVIGTPAYPIQQDYWDHVNILGNRSGEATGVLRIVKWQGHSEEKYAVTDVSEYPAADAPFQLEIIRQDYGSDAQAWDAGTTYSEGDFATSGGMWRSLQDNNLNNTPFGGSPFWEFINQSGPWGWVVIMISDDPLRDITARAISQHSATPCNDGNFLFTTGAFVQDGSYDNRYYTECPPGNRDTVLQDVNFALRLGAAYEGWFVLPESGEDVDGYFWSADAP